MIKIGIVLAAIFWLLEATLHHYAFGEGNIWRALIPADPNELWMRSLISVLMIAFGVYAHVLIARIKESERKREALHLQLEEALSKALSGFLTICANCKSVRNKQGGWSRVEDYVQNHTDASFTHTICEHCGEKLYPDTLKSIRERQ